MKRLSLALTFVLCAAFVFCAFGYAQAAKREVMIIASKDFQDDEFMQPKKILEDNGIKVTVVSSSLNVAIGMNGARDRKSVV